MSEADNKVIKEKKIPLDAPCHLADTVDSSFVEEMDSVSESVNNLLIRTAIMKVTVILYTLFQILKAICVI